MWNKLMEWKMPLCKWRTFWMVSWLICFIVILYIDKWCTVSYLKEIIQPLTSKKFPTSLEKKLLLEIYRNIRTFAWSSRPDEFCKKGVLYKISQNSQENICARVSFFNKVAGLRHDWIIDRDYRKRLWNGISGFPYSWHKFAI